jgi:hypothetical protein
MNRVAIGISGQRLVGEQEIRKKCLIFPELIFPELEFDTENAEREEKES